MQIYDLSDSRLAAGSVAVEQVGRGKTSMSEINVGPAAGTYWVQERFIAGQYPGGWSERKLRENLRRLLQAGATFFLGRSRGPIVPVQELPGAVKAHGFCQLIGVAGIAIDACVVVANGIVASSGKHASEEDRQCLTVRGAGFVTADSLLRHQVWVRARVACRPILVVYVHH